ncbi:hypothetical protein NX059_000701 [Plenodomus lindquistii]|nr:hypothetical protein NX059_000701 [Plenodomus lindquistii]
MVQLQSWNDAGESHYMGDIWPEPMSQSTMVKALANGYDHTGYKEVLRAFILAYKCGDKTTANMFPTNDKMIQGTFWHHTLTKSATCKPFDKLIKSPDVTKNVEDVISGIVLVEKDKTGLVAVVKTGTTELPHVNFVPGFNKFKLAGMTPGKVQIEVWDVITMVGGGYAPLPVTTSGPLCKYNFQVVGFPN